MFNIISDQGDATQDLKWQQFYTQLGKFWNLIIPSVREDLDCTHCRWAHNAITLESSLLLAPEAERSHILNPSGSISR